MENSTAKGEIRASKETTVLELLVGTSKVITSEVELEKLVQRVTDLGTELTGAAFGAFFYNVENLSGEKYVLYTISGVPKEAFSKFPMPRNTAIFNPTFTGQGTVRYEDVTQQPHFGKSAPYHGMPKGHLPVKSYLATSVISSFTGEVLGGLFFGHPDPGIFTEQSEKLIEGIAAQAAIAMANARLFEEKKQSEQKLLEQNAVINTIANNAMHALFLLDENQVCTYMNPAAEQLIGYTLSEMSDKPIHALLHRSHPDGRHYPIEDSLIDQALPTRNQTRGEDVFTHKDGHFIPVAITASPIIEEGVPKGTLVEARNTTEEKHLADIIRQKEARAKHELEQKVKERTAELEKINFELLQFTSVASHDLKEPLRKISIFGKLLRERIAGQADPTTIKYTDTILDSSRRMTTLIEDLLQFSRLSQQEGEWEKVDLNDVIGQIVSDLQVTIQEKKASIHYENMPAVKGIALRLGQVFQNLISNSLKFSHPDRPPAIEITTTLIARDGKPLHWIKYADNGIGFEDVHAEKIFEVFQRLHTKDKYDGTGIGLAIVKKIIAMMQGEIRAHGQAGKGATFEILLPA
ncbi:MAG TPA: ATP-binding protein [Chryseolinea sp.]